MITNRNAMTFIDFSDLNHSRARRWHKGSIDTWSVNDWMVAMAGEAGEACDAAKKLRRLDDGIENYSSERFKNTSDTERARDKIAEELADTVIYADLACRRIGRSLVLAIIDKFNRVSAEHGFPERLDYES